MHNNELNRQQVDNDFHPLKNLPGYKEVSPKNIKWSFSSDDDDDHNKDLKMKLKQLENDSDEEIDNHRNGKHNDYDRKGDDSDYNLKNEASFIINVEKNELKTALNSALLSSSLSEKPEIREDKKESIRAVGEENKSSKLIQIDGLKPNEIECGEVPLINVDTAYVTGPNYIYGKMVVTNYKMVFLPSDPNFLKVSKMNKYFFNVPLGIISRVERMLDKKNQTMQFVEIGTKDARLFKFFFNTANSMSENLSIKVTEVLCKYAFPDEKRPHFFCFDYKENIKTDQINGWCVYDPIKEYERMGIQFNQSENPQYPFRLFQGNVTNELSVTYPQFVVVPNAMSDSEVAKCANFRTKFRLPALTWLNKKNGASLWRSSQTKNGLTSNRSVEDEKMLKCIAKTIEYFDGDPRIVIFDARPYLSALANKMQGAGYENTNYYEHSEIVFCDIENIHAVRESYKKLTALCSNSNINSSKWLTTLEQTNWLQLLSAILSSTVKIIEALKNKRPVLVHCSDGWDRTSALCSLAQLSLDPFYRTLEGFQILVEKDWLSFGHQFARRLGHGNRTHNDDQRCPIFIQWLDCLYQIYHQYPTAFEFNVRLLVELAHHVFTCKYGTFLYNTDAERRMKHINKSTVSFWTHIYQNKEKYTNPFFQTDEFAPQDLIPQSSYMRLKLWEEYYLKWTIWNEYPSSNIFHSANDYKESLMKNQRAINSSISIYKRELDLARSAIDKLKKKLKDAGLEADEDLSPIGKPNKAGSIEAKLNGHRAGEEESSSLTSSYIMVDKPAAQKHS